MKTKTNKTLRTISLLVLFFFTWTSVGVCQIADAVYRPEEVEEMRSGKGYADIDSIGDRFFEANLL